MGLGIRVPTTGHSLGKSLYPPAPISSSVKWGHSSVHSTQLL